MPSVYRPIAIPMNGGFRGDVPGLHRPDDRDTCPLGQAPVLLNTIFNSGRNRKWPGRIKYTTAQLKGGPKLDTAAPVLLIRRYPLWAGVSFLIVSDGRDLFKFNPGGAGSWDCLTPVYITGTATFTTASALVVGAGTGWTAANCKPGMAIKHNADGVYYEVQSLNAGTQTITLTANYTQAGGAGAAYTLRQRLSLLGQHWVRATVARNLCMVVNGIDSPLAWTGSDATFATTALGAAPAARFVSAFHQENLLVMGGLLSDPAGIHNSDVDDYDEWALGYAATYPFHASPGLLSGLDGLAESLYVFKTDSIYQGQWTGAYTKIGWRHLTNITDGPIGAKSLVRLGNLWGYFGDGRIRAFDGYQAPEIGAGVREWVFGPGGLDRTYLDRVVGAAQPRWSLALWSFPSTGSGGICNRTVAFDYERQQWFCADRGYSALAEYDLSQTDVAWDSLTGTIDAQTRIFDLLGTTPQPVLLAGTAEGYLHYLAWAISDDGATIQAQRQTPLVRLAGAGQAAEIGWVVVDTTAAVGSTVVVALYGSENGVDRNLLESVRCTVSSGGEVTARFRSAATWAAVGLANDQKNEELGVIGVQIFVRGRGR